MIRRSQKNCLFYNSAPRKNFLYFSQQSGVSDSGRFAHPALDGQIGFAGRTKKSRARQNILPRAACKYLESQDNQ